MVPGGSLEHFVALLAGPARREAVEFVADLASQGATTEELILDLLAPAGREVGDRWQRREWNVAQEHAATSVIDAALAMLSLEIEIDIGVDTDTGPRTGRLIVACVEGEWHSLAARMVAELARLAGWDVTFLGASLPAADLGDHVRELEPDAVALSCSVPLFLKGAQRSIDACRSAGVRVIAGGPGFGERSDRALRLGADAWASDARYLGDVLERCSRSTRDNPAATDEEHLLLETVRPELVGAVLDGVRPLGVGAEAHTLVQLREGLDALVTSVENACLVEDAGVLVACAPVVERLLPDELVGQVPVTDLLRRLRPALGRRSDRAAALTDDALGVLTGGVAR